MIRLLSIIALLLPISGWAQYINPPAGHVFDDTGVSKFEISIDPQFLNEILAEGNEQSDIEYSTDFTFTNIIGSEFLSGVGFRLRGNTSRYSAKKSFKIAVNAFLKGRDYHGLEKINLNGEHNDPSIIRSKIGWDLMREAGAIAARSNHVELYINGEYKGLYMNIEHIDEEFIEERFGNKTGNLYKCLYPADLSYLGPNPTSYMLEVNGRPVYELKTNKDTPNYSRLTNFIVVLASTSDTEFVTEIEKVFDVNSFLKALAVEVLMAHWDNYSINKNNFYLYENPTDNKIYYIPFDLDNTLGIDWYGIDWAEINIYDWFFPDDDRPLIKRVMATPKYRRAFTSIMTDLLEKHFNPDVLFPRIDEIKNLIQASAEADQYRTLDYNFTIEDFNDSYTVPLSANHVRYGIKEFIQRRYETALSQLEVISSIQEENQRFSVYPNPANDVLYIDMHNWNQESKNIQILDLQGRVVYHEKTYSSTLRWEIPDNKLSNGTYLISVTDDSGDKAIKRVVLKRSK